MKKIAKFLLVLTVVSSLSTSSLFAQYDYDYECCDPDPCCATEQGMSFLGLDVWTWVTGGLTIGGIAAIAATHSNRKAND
ncbi:MAG: hypothetical protein S4CHLAM81_05240 [Chlamydiales bacterium]|nr:hypothetical protein [Chlamydiales bacterium]MCH9635310.1 hypothetical protein [Chlamydiales bacterium]MCH9704215.1 hypothetical protein [Chlamydiota bacterium]